MNIKREKINLKYKEGCINISIDKFIKFKYINKKENNRIWGMNHIESKYYFYLEIPGILTLDTNYIGKPFIGRIYLTKFGRKDFRNILT